ncbi:zinc finger protein-like protein OZF [Lophiostoma macrostomum CBS 122681]|uniref:Zinc finger protein-like protein OZF n=1 Tax=Lophiostoma macrostomum CBS 122681 TaxID=1314788 RepID=A0A6A6TCP2_9PLEO|nr:zinc finger protein-like protein OZF [Lophiostoma macrostomum CBS 122681]
MAAVVAPQHAGLWQRRSDQTLHMPNMNMSGLVSPYDASSRTVTHPPTSRGFQPTTSHMDINMPLFSAHPMTTSVPYQSGAFAFDSLSVNPYNMQQTFPVHYPPTLPHAATYAGPADVQSLQAARDTRNEYAMERTTPPVKAEADSPAQPSHLYNDASYGEDYKPTIASTTNPADGIDFATDVDTLMKAIQAKQRPSPHQQQRPLPPQVREISHPVIPETIGSSPQQKEEAPTVQKPRKRYHCSIDGCNKSFYQKTHLEIHTRAHTGVKPFLCKEPSCGQRFSQLGNLKTHERRHTGERPYRCEICGKTFAQRGNVRAHKIVHQQIKPFTCKLDDCGKQFTQLGNLKVIASFMLMLKAPTDAIQSHQNKFHAGTLRFLTHKFASIQGGDPVSQHEKELWEYFASLYKNSNKGIKGRGKDRRITAIPSTATSVGSVYANATATSLSQNYTGSYHHDGSDRTSRSSSLSSETSTKPSDGYDFNASMQTGFQGTSSGYDDMVFPERKLY